MSDTSILARILLFCRALPLSISQTRQRLIKQFLQIPLVVLSMLVFIWCINLFTSKLPFSFPASVMSMLIIFFLLLLSSATLGRARTNIPLQYLEPASDFLLKWISMFFCPSFVLLPVEESSVSIGSIELVKIVLLFFVSFFLFIVLAWAIVTLLTFISPFKSREKADQDADDGIGLGDPIPDSPPPEPTSGEAYELSTFRAQEEHSMSLGSFPSPNPGRTETPVPPSPALSRTPTLPRPAAAAIRKHHGVPSRSTPDLGADEAALESPLSGSRKGSMYDLRQDRWEGTPRTLSRSQSQATLVPSTPNSHPNVNPNAPKPSFSHNILPSVPPTAEQQLAARLSPWLPTLFYSLMFLLGLPLFYLTPHTTPGPSLPLFLSLNVLSFLFSVLLVPARIRRFLHPILTCSLLTALGIWALGAVRGWTIQQSLGAYSTGSRYLVLFDPTRRGKVAPPGAGDVLYSMLDASIVSLAIPMYRYRGELKCHAFEMFSTTIPLAVLSLFIYPLVGRALKLAPSRGLAFAARSVTTPMAIPLEASLHGDPGLTVIFCILTGVLGALAGPSLLRLLRVKPEDYITIGIVLGCTASAISTAALLGENPRAAAISSLAFVLYGVACVGLTAVPQVVQVMQTLAGM
ncbi:hypothetical protein DACRYDRAFT_115857 [Dacryopinax primogenitus]|uniref:LrgB-domain-containing protein n=1 Tax=Dacryopinax primogenitus (strain DJM 731) TaxID=1858805 RepID=M5G3U1_DACPD|nr:uncharacterized protein DACRYDRAFT_115857 [Dacryopinax primogenitus]EJU02880.1 hypothetical protein DACRYDRAFT_115857 [Dacryopinax primogenitus]